MSNLRAILYIKLLYSVNLYIIYVKYKEVCIYEFYQSSHWLLLIFFLFFNSLYADSSSFGGDISSLQIKT